jgi:ribokinase
MPSIIVIGSLNMDLVGCAPRIPVPGETIVAHRYFEEPGGKGANQAYAAAKLHKSVRMTGCVGDDDFGRRMRQNLESVGCDVSRIGTIAGSASGIALIFVADDGQNSIVIAPGANGRLSPAHVEATPMAASDCVLLQLESPLETVAAAAARARAAGARVILDPAPAQALDDSLLRLVDILTPNETEAAILAGLPPGRVEPDRALFIAERLQKRGPGAVIVKLGDQGCVFHTGAARGYIDAAHGIRACDTTAAGDVFNAALAVAICEGRELAEACEFANFAAALSVTKMGAQAAAPERAELEAFIEDHE